MPINGCLRGMNVFCKPRAWGLALLLLVSFSAWSQTKVVWGILDKEYPPFMIRDGQMFYGIDYDLTVEIFKRLEGYELEVKSLPLARLPMAFATGKVDFLYSFKSNRLGQDAIFTDQALRWVAYGMVTLPHKTFPYQSISDLSGKAIGINNAVGVTDSFNQAEQDGLFKLVRVAGFNTLAKMLIKGRIDAVLANPDVIRAYAQRVGHEITVLKKSPEAAKDFCAVISPKSQLAQSTVFRSQYSKALRQIYADGSYNKIAERYGAKLNFNPPKVK